jgi:hypothetical protein
LYVACKSTLHNRSLQIKDTFCPLYKGTFGQPKIWDIHQEVSFQHPMVPYDVLVDPESIPKHPAFESDEESLEVIEDDEDLDAEHEMETTGKDVRTFSAYIKTVAPIFKIFN